MIRNPENLFLIILAFIWICGAVLQDLKRREVDNLWNFSLIGFALAYRSLVSIFLLDYRFFINGLLGFAIFLFLGYLFYYLRIFAGGDAKLLIALGTILPLSFNWIINFKIFGLFILSFLTTGSIYVLIWAFVLIIFNFNSFSKEFLKQFKEYKQMFWISMIFVIFWFSISFIIDFRFVFISGVILLFPILFVFAKAIEESCMIRNVNVKDLTEGEWLYRDVKVGKRVIKSSWEGISKQDVKFLKKHKKTVFIKVGVPFTPGFLIGFIVLLFLINKFSLF